MQYWLMKSEPNKYSWDDLEKDTWTFWDGVRNYSARLNLRAMEVGDRAFFYHSNLGKEIVGIVEIIKTSYQDPTTDDDRWVAVDIKPVKKLETPVTLQQVKADEQINGMELVRLMRLSVSKVSEAEYNKICELAGEIRKE
ncbi:MAG: putative RNA-binding protein with PUA-like domain [Bacteroidia bacterium]|jgi:predicted RNA-binding protein with PUA-like domain